MDQAQQEGRQQQITPRNPAPSRIVRWTRYGRWTDDGREVHNALGQAIYIDAPLRKARQAPRIIPPNPDVASSRLSLFSLPTPSTTKANTSSTASQHLHIPVLR